MPTRYPTRSSWENTLDSSAGAGGAAGPTLGENEHTWRERAMRAVNAAFPHVEHEAWAQCERLLSQALFVTQFIEQDQMRGEETGRLLYETASYLLDRARYTEAEPLFQRALHIWEQQFGPDIPRWALCSTNWRPPLSTRRVCGCRAALPESVAHLGAASDQNILMWPTCSLDWRSSTINEVSIQKRSRSSSKPYTSGSSS